MAEKVVYERDIRNSRKSMVEIEAAILRYCLGAGGGLDHFIEISRAGKAR